MVWRLTLVVVAAAAALAPIPADAIERLYSAGVYPPLQRTLTAISNRAEVSLFDVLSVSLVVAWLGMLVRDMVAARRIGWTRSMWRVSRRTILLAASVYLAFLLTWGFNYRRPSLGEHLGLDLSQATPEVAATFARTVVDRLNERHASAHAAPPLLADAVDPSLAAAFHAAHRLLGASDAARPARPKRSWLDLYFRAAGVDGFTAPFFAETLVPSDLLAVERPAILAHEWGHLAGYADEGEANFVGWLTCLQGDGMIQYSGWLSMYGEAVRVLSREEQDRAMTRLQPGPREDLRAVAARRRQNLNPTVARAGWHAYDQYLRANRVESGTASYGEVLQLVLGTTLGREAWQAGEGQEGQDRQEGRDGQDRQEGQEGRMEPLP